MMQWWIQDLPLGGRRPVRGGIDLQRGHFSVKMYVKINELGPIKGWGGGGGLRRARFPRSANVMYSERYNRFKITRNLQSINII